MQALIISSSNDQYIYLLNSLYTNNHRPSKYPPIYTHISWIKYPPSHIYNYVTFSVTVNILHKNLKIKHKNLKIKQSGPIKFRGFKGVHTSTNFRFQAAHAHQSDHVVSYYKENVERSVTHALCLATGDSEREIKNPPSSLLSLVSSSLLALLLWSWLCSYIALTTVHLPTN